MKNYLEGLAKERAVKSDIILTGKQDIQIAEKKTELTHVQ
jgi:hypothetical protein